ncbi:MAG: transcription-repair coupling factor [Desulfobacteraceae bacterium]
MNHLSDILEKREGRVDLTGVSGSEKAYLVSRFFLNTSASVFVVLPDQKSALRFLDDLCFFMPGHESSLVYFPGYHIMPFKSLVYHSETSSKRLSALYRITSARDRIIVVTYVDTLLHRMIPRNVLSSSAELVINGEEIDRDLLISTLNAQGYTRVSLVEEPGDYSVRGGTLDVFSPGLGNPVRIELFGDYVESLRAFSPVSQRGIQELEEAVFIPASEAVVEKKHLPDILGRIRLAGARADMDAAKIRSCVEKVRDQGRFPGMESMLSLIYTELDTFFDYFPEKALLVLDEPGELEKKALDFEKKAFENYQAAVSDQVLCVDPESIYIGWEDVKSVMDRQNPVSFNHLHIEKSIPRHKRIPLDFRDNSALTARLKREEKQDYILTPLADFISDSIKQGMAVIVACPGESRVKRLVSLLAPYGIEPEHLERFSDITGKKPGVFYVKENVSSGFSAADDRFVLITDQEIFGVKRQTSRPRRKRAVSEFITPEELKKGDIVVHLEHGLGRYDGLSTISVDGISGDFILITYRDEDKLYLPVDRMDMIEKYLGIEGYTPLLDKIGGKTWKKSRARARKEVEKMAGDLLTLYAKRRVKNGFSFSVSDGDFIRFEQAFPYEETPDQLKAIDDVIHDMEQDTPMDRLVCGDVGYGKTEVAVRAAYKAAKDGRQVAVVVPTTILAEQHLNTFRERLKDTAVVVEALSRFRTRKEQQDIIKNLESGQIDIVIGTHRVLQKDIAFKDLGLLVIDEEQRFGVRHKEALKSRRSTVDVLALTATPIPRSLHMSLTGMRDISVISTPPRDRQAIVSYISEYDDAIAAEAVRRELARGGQIFFIHNNIKTIFKTAERLQKLVPEARIGVAHGRLSEANLEKIMIQFINRDIDLLVCTTIVESGLDIPSANTMIINRADRFGLSQIYQLRGRIGRGEDQAYAYLFVPDEKRLTRDAKKRLAALMEHRDLGSGFQIAMKDLQIRGAGSALGGAQSGHIAAVGYDMFLKLLDEAVADLKGKPLVKTLEPEINIPVSASISEDYVQSIEQRLTIYRRLSQMTILSEVADMQQELVDRFGRLPDEAGNMLFKIMLRVMAVKAGIKRLDLSFNFISMVFSEIHQKRPFNSVDSLPVLFLSHEFTAENALKIVLGRKRTSISKSLVEAKKILKHIALYVNN